LNAIEEMMSVPLDGFHLADEDFAARLALASKGLMRATLSLVRSTESLARIANRKCIRHALFAQAWREMNHPVGNADALNPFLAPRISKAQNLNLRT
jgi:hypothetical protein